MSVQLARSNEMVDVSHLPETLLAMIDRQQEDLETIQLYADWLPESEVARMTKEGQEYLHSVVMTVLGFKVRAHLEEQRDAECECAGNALQALDSGEGRIVPVNYSSLGNFFIAEPNLRILLPDDPLSQGHDYIVTYTPFSPQEPHRVKKGAGFTDSWMVGIIHKKVYAGFTPLKRRSAKSR